MIISDQKETPATSYVMRFPFNLYDVSIIVDWLVSSLLKSSQKGKLSNKELEDYWRNFRTSASIVTCKHNTRSPTITLWHSECSNGMDRSRTAFFTLTHSSSSAPNPINLTRTSFNKQYILSNDLLNKYLALTAYISILIPSCHKMIDNYDHFNISSGWVSVSVNAIVWFRYLQLHQNWEIGEWETYQHHTCKSKST